MRYNALFFVRDADRLHLHSFPTRRSSDLAAVAAAAIDAVARARPAFRGAGAVAAVRSEEHTSELQSRRDLVCRLLLEKKKSVRPIQKIILHIMPYDVSSM